MHKPQDSYLQALAQAQQAAERGEVQLARHWAKYASVLAPGAAEPWLLIGDLAPLENKDEFYTKALNLNPECEAARQRLADSAAHIRQAEEEKQPVLDRSIRLGAPFQAAIGKRISVKAGILPLLVIALFGLIAWLGISTLTVLAETTAGFFPSATMEPLLAARVNLITATPTPTATFTPTPTPTRTPTNTPTSTRTPRPPTATPRPPVGSSPGNIGSQEFWIEVDLSSQQMIAYRGDQVLNTFTISSGKWSTPTVVGNFQVYLKLTSQTMIGPGYVQPDVPYVLYFYEDYSIHGTYWHNNFGTPVSHGCVNLPTNNASWVFQYAKIGTWVIIHH
ncbi:MAG: L,D-transpeptidase [Chloroflexota bacterium]